MQQDSAVLESSCPRTLTVQTFFHGPLYMRWVRDFEHNWVSNRECRGLCRQAFLISDGELVALFGWWWDWLGGNVKLAKLAIFDHDFSIIEPKACVRVLGRFYSLIF